jgi:radical SAM/Cys-rich protein
MHDSMKRQAPPTSRRSLVGRGHELAILDHQRAVLHTAGAAPPFARTLSAAGLTPLRAGRLEVLQLNLGRMCNQTCRHCHVDAGPDRRERMDLATLERCLEIARLTAVPTVDLTGGAPEMHPRVRAIVDALAVPGRRIIDRCNLTILLAPGFEDLPEFLAARRVEVVASLPHVAARTADAQRGEGVFDRSIEALRRLNALGYGVPGSGLVLNLVHNPAGAFLPPPQSSIEPEYRRVLRDRHGVAYNDLYVLANLPINRFLEFLVATGQHDEYMARLVAAFNPATVAGLMCHSTLSVGWDGRLHDCDFNQMLGLGLAGGLPSTIHELDPDALTGRPIRTDQHCYGCTAGAGTTCAGAIIRESGA